MALHARRADTARRSSPAATAPADVNLISNQVEEPLSWKASATYMRRVTSRLRLSATLLGTETSGNYQYADRNLGAPASALHNEANRPVFVPLASIPASGKTTARFAFVNPQFTHVLELISTGRASARSAILEGTLALPRGASVSASFTWSDAHDNSSFNCCIARTSSLFTPVKGDPSDLSGSWGPSDYDVPHKLVVSDELPAWFGFVLGARYVGNTGRTFSVVVNGDIKGDDYSGNDLAVAFDPNDPSTPAAIATAMRRVLDNPNNAARDYLRRNLGRIADRNGGHAPWTDRVDLRLTRAFRTLAGQRATLVVDVYNFTNLLNPDRGGQYLLPQGISASNPISQQLTLLNVVGFDGVAHRYKYTVNDNGGVLTKRNDPYQIPLGIRYEF